MKIYFKTTANLDNCYNIGYWIVKKEYEDYGWTFTKNQSEADIIMFSIASFDNLEYVAKWIKDLGTTNKIIMIGGNYSKYCAGFERYFDIACIGHVFNFAKEFSEIVKSAGINNKEKILKLADEKIKNAYVPKHNQRKYEKNKKYSKVDHVVYYDDYIDWKKIKAYKVDETWYYGLASVGCKNKCLFCQTSWVEPFEEEPSTHKLKTYKEKLGDKLILTTNDITQTKHKDLQNKSFGSFTVKGFLHEKEIVTKNIRLGIEGASERIRESFAKPIKKDDLIKSFEKAMREKVSLKLFYIDGIPYTNEQDEQEFYETFRWNTECKSRIFIKMTSFSPMAHTPMQYSPIKNKLWFNWNKVHNKMLEFGNTNIRTLRSRCELNSYKYNIITCLDSMATKNIIEKFNCKALDSIEKVDNMLSDLGYNDIAKGYTPDDILPNDFIITPIKEKIEKAGKIYYEKYIKGV